MGFGDYIEHKLVVEDKEAEQEAKAEEAVRCWLLAGSPESAGACLTGCWAVPGGCPGIPGSLRRPHRC